MKKEYITCERCGRRIAKKITSKNGYDETLWLKAACGKKDPDGIYIRACKKCFEDASDERLS
jgi:hypothetical protein